MKCEAKTTDHEQAVALEETMLYAIAAAVYPDDKMDPYSQMFEGDDRKRVIHEALVRVACSLATMNYRGEDTDDPEGYITKFTDDIKALWLGVGKLSFPPCG
jgi:hypothetical protein